MTAFSSRAAVSTLILALVITSIGSFFIIKGIAGLPLPDSSVVVAFISLSFGMSITSGFYTGLYRGLFLKKISPFQDYGSLVSYIALVQTMAFFLFSMHGIPETGFYFGTIALQCWLSWLNLSIAKAGLNVKHPSVNRLPWLAAASTGIIGILVWPFRNFWPLEYLLAATAFWQSATSFTILLATWVWFAMHPKYRIQNQSLSTAFLLRLKREENNLSTWFTTLIAVGIQLSAISITLLLLQSSQPISSILIVMGIHFHVAPCLLDAWSSFSQFGADKENYLTLSRLAAQSAKRLLKRQSNNHQAWATTIGLKTAIFTIDHDPESQIVNNIPATLMRIRNDEIFNILSKITQNQTLSLTPISQKILGAIDPEQSIRPCIDALNLCATLYLDAGPIIERRISGLVALLPLVNPGLSSSINPTLITSLLKRSHWFFHFDFTWVDQSLINTPAATRFGIQMDPVSEEIQWALLTEMRKTHSIGNFLWLGRDAYERLLQEAPHLASIMQPQVLKNSKGEEKILFIIKFEQLIPRLQRYYGLDDVRSRIIDYEPSPEAQRLLSLISLQISAAKTPDEKRRIVDSLTSYQWRGFKEKDQALKLLLKLYQLEVALNNSSPITDVVFKESFTDLLRRSISQIGYPSQILNQAHIYKIELRNIPNLRAHALNHASFRFEEAWVLMSNLNYQYLSSEDIQMVRGIIQNALKESQVMQVIFVHGKMIDAAIALGRRRDSTMKDLDLLHRILDAIITCGTSDECIALAMDGIVTVSNKLNQRPVFSEKTTAYFDQRMLTANETARKFHPAIATRWQEHRSQAVAKVMNENKAS